MLIYLVVPWVGSCFGVIHNRVEWLICREYHLTLSSSVWEGSFIWKKILFLWILSVSLHPLLGNRYTCPSGPKSRELWQIFKCLQVSLFWKKISLFWILSMSLNSLLGNMYTCPPVPNSQELWTIFKCFSWGFFYRWSLVRFLGVSVRV